MKKFFVFLILLTLLASLFLSSCEKSNDSQQYSIFLSAKAAGYEGSYEEWLDSIRGEKGDIGPDGVGIADISLTSSENNIDTYTITLSNGNTHSFQVHNGEDALIPYVGENGNWFLGDTDTGKTSVGDKGDKGDTGLQGKSAYDLYCEKYGYTGTLDEWLEEFFVPKGMSASEIYVASIDAVVTILNYDDEGELKSRGSGFFIDEEGTILTAFHVIKEAYSMKIMTNDGGQYEVVQVVGFDMDRDLAAIKTNYVPGSKHLELEEDNIVPGETIYALGSSLGFLDGTFSSGIISAKLRSETIDSDAEIDMAYIQFTAPISPGNSGGPLINAKGKVVGVVDSHYTNGNNLNLAVSIKELENVDLTYKRNVSNFYKDTVFFKVHFLDIVKYEQENNSSMALADLFNNGSTFYASASSNDWDYYKLVIDGTEKVRLFVFFYHSDGKMYYPVIYDKQNEEWLDIGWNNSYIEYVSVHGGAGAFIDIDPGTYYVRIEGQNDTSVNYYLYLYYDKLSNIKYPIDMESCFG